MVLGIASSFMSNERNRCINCKKMVLNISSSIGVCVNCIRQRYKDVQPILKEVHHDSRRKFNLPLEPPRDPKGVKCNMCVNECQIPRGERGYCGLRKNENGKLIHLGGIKIRGLVECYYDPLPTNCVAAWVCGGSKEIGYKNLAVFYNACTFNCLFCQNWHFRERVSKSNTMSAEELNNLVDKKTACICYFGGDPTPQLVHSIEVSRMVAKKRKDVRICWETNGSMHPELLKEIVSIILKSGGCIKFDLKSWNENLHLALTGITNKRTLDNFRYVATMVKRRPNPPLLVASTLLIPGYIDIEEIREIARFIASLNSGIPYSLLGFYPHFYLKDLPTTSRAEAQRCLEVAQVMGVEQANIGNVHLLS